MLFWIDATQEVEAPPLFGLSLLERHIRVVKRICDQNAMAESNLNKIEELAPQLAAELKRTSIPGRVSEIRVELREGAPIPDIGVKLGSHISLNWSTSDKPLGQRLRTAIEDAKGAPVICVSADAEIDGRLVIHLATRRNNRVFIDGEGDNRAAAIRIRGEVPEFDESANDLVTIAESLIDCGSAKEVNRAKFDGYIPKLRRENDPYLIKITDVAERDRVAKFLFESNYKGATDFMTKHVYPPLVWRMVNPLAEWRVHPNAVTIIAMIATFAAVPLFAAGAWIPGMTLAFVMSVLDSVDGKLARLTYTSTPQGNLLDHGTDLIHPPIWYFGWAWGLSGGDPFSGVFQASIWMMGIYVFDRMLERLFKVCTGRSIQDFRPIDVKLRTFVSRRNVNLAVFVVALMVGLGHEAFYAIVAWQGLTAAYHFVRVVQFWDGNPDEEFDMDVPDSGIEASDDLSNFEAFH